MDEQKTTGTLYIVATPIGNSRDMSERGREILSTADIIAAEDTRRSVVLLNKLGIRGNSLSANHKFNEYGKAKWFIEQLVVDIDLTGLPLNIGIECNILDKLQAHLTGKLLYISILSQSLYE